jgi:hypothetical protein
LPRLGGEMLVQRLEQRLAVTESTQVGKLHARALVDVRQRPFTGFDPLPRTLRYLAFREVAVLRICQRQQAERCA